MFILRSKLQLKPFRVDDIISPLFEDKSHDKDRSLVCFLCGSATISLEGKKKLRNRDLTGRMVGVCRSDQKLLNERVVIEQSLAFV